MTYTRQLRKTKATSTSEAARGGEDVEVFAHVAGVDEGDVAVLRDGVAGVEEADAGDDDAEHLGVDGDDGAEVAALQADPGDDAGPARAFVAGALVRHGHPVHR